MDLSSQKKELRNKCFEQRNTLSDAEWESKSNEVTSSILRSEEYKKAETIHCYISMNSRKEVNTFPLISQMLTDGKNVVVPVTDFNSGILDHSLLTSLNELETNKWGVPEPSVIKPVDTGMLDLILIPLLAADRHGNRLGYGKGFYDRFLEGINSKAFGVVFEEFILEEIPVESFDQKLDGLFSEKGIIYT